MEDQKEEKSIVIGACHDPELTDENIESLCEHIRQMLKEQREDGVECFAGIWILGNDTSFPECFADTMAHIALEEIEPLDEAAKESLSEAIFTTKEILTKGLVRAVTPKKE